MERNNPRGITRQPTKGRGNLGPPWVSNNQRGITKGIGFIDPRVSPTALLQPQSKKGISFLYCYPTSFSWHCGVAQMKKKKNGAKPLGTHGAGHY